MDNAKELRELLRILVRQLGMLDNHQTKFCQISPLQCQALVEIGRAKKLTLNQLAELLDVENYTMSRNINTMVDKDIVHRITDSKDRRYIQLSLTNKGKVLYIDIEKDMEQYYQTVLSSIPNKKKEQILESLHLLIKAIQ